MQEAKMQEAKMQIKKVNFNRESTVEEYLVKQLKQHCNAKVIKLQGSGNKGLPDRLVLMPSGLVCFVECKRAKQPVRKVQRTQLLSKIELENMGFLVFNISSKTEVDELVDRMRR